MAKFRFIFLFVIIFLISGCSVELNQSKSNVNSTNQPNNNSVQAEPSKEITANTSNTNTPTGKNETAGNASCLNLKHEDLMIDKKQTFAIDFAPFEKSCFVTFHDPEFDDPPLRSQMFIYKNGKQIFEFPDQFGMGNTTCWVDAVSFEDLNNDQLKDVIVVGKCGAKMGDYNENMVYLNNGKTFVTDPNSNAETMDFSKIEEIKDFVKKNPGMFSK